MNSSEGKTNSLIVLHCEKNIYLEVNTQLTNVIEKRTEKLPMVFFLYNFVLICFSFRQLNCFSKNADSESTLSYIERAQIFLDRKGKISCLGLFPHVCRKRTPPVVCLRCLFLDYSYTGFPIGDWLKFKCLKSSSEQTTVDLIFTAYFFH